MCNRQPILVIVGTRPEGIKMVPVYCALKEAGLPVLLVSTAQHEQLLYDVFDVFGIKPDVDLAIMRQGQDLFYLTQALLQKTKELFIRTQPSLILVQGDTTSTFVATLSAFYLAIPVMHIEAGLRTDDIRSPFPEEFNRRCVSLLAQHHFAPTAGAAAHLVIEGIPDHAISIVGNTVVDALYMVQEAISQGRMHPGARVRRLIAEAHAAGKRILLFTMHRRESFDGGMYSVLQTLADFLRIHTDVVCFYPYHPNPSVTNTVHQVRMHELPNCYLFEPFTYVDMVYVLSSAHVVVTDSGGVQEEAASLGKYVVVVRDKTERTEGISIGLAYQVGTDPERIMQTLEALYATSPAHVGHGLYGDGKSAQKIVEHIMNFQHVIPEQKFEPALVQPRTEIPAADKQEQEMMMHVVILGLGYIGLPTAIVAVDHACRVTGVDVDERRVAAINSGDAVIQEPEVYERLQIALSKDTFKAVTTICSADYYVIAVPTPFKEQKKADLQYVYAALDMISTVIKKGDTVLIESTIPVGTTDICAQYIATKTGFVVGSDIYVAHCPERVLPGNIFYELIHNDRIIGGVDQASSHKAREFYAQFVQGTLYLTDAKSAELVKLAENSSRDVQVAFAHQLASISYQVGVDPYQIIDLANKHPRVKILQPSAGVGGHCIAVDPWFLIETCPQQTALLQAARHVNDTRPLQVLEYIHQAVNEYLACHGKQPRVLLMGLTYKPDVDDVRESPAIEIAERLHANVSAKLFVCDPYLKPSVVKGLLGDCMVGIADGLEAADIVVFLVAHTRFKLIDRTLLATKKVLDFCGVLHQQMTEPEMHWPTISAAHMKRTPSIQAAGD